MKVLVALLLASAPPVIRSFGTSPPAPPGDGCKVIELTKSTVNELDQNNRDVAGGDKDEVSTDLYDYDGEDADVGPAAGEEIVERRIQVWWPSEETWYAGVVASYDGTLHTINYDDNSVVEENLGEETYKLIEEGQEAELPPPPFSIRTSLLKFDLAPLAECTEIIRAQREVFQESSTGEYCDGPGGQSSNPDKPASEAPPTPLFAVGARVEARYEGGDEWYAGVINAVRGYANSVFYLRYDVAYDDGDFEQNVLPPLVREECVPGHVTAYKMFAAWDNSSTWNSVFGSWPAGFGTQWVPAEPSFKIKHSMLSRDVTTRVETDQRVAWL